MSKLLGTLVLLCLCSAAWAAPPEFLSVDPARSREWWRQRFREGNFDRQLPTAKVGMYEKLELNIDLRATYSNPFDPDEVDLWAEFTAPSGKVQKIWGFYNPARWASAWMVRFAPTEV